MRNFVKLAVLLIIGLGILVLILVYFRPFFTSSTFTQGMSIPGSFEGLGDFGGRGRFCYRKIFFSERFAARIESFSLENFKEFSENHYGAEVVIGAETGLLSFEHFIGEFPQDCRIELTDLKDFQWVHLGSAGFGKHGSLEYCYSDEAMVMIIVGTKAF